MRTILLNYLLLLSCLCQSSKGYACVDSIWTQVAEVKCYGLRDGKISVTKVFGGQAPYYFSLDGASFSTNPVFKTLWAGAYTLFVRDANGCIKSFKVTVREPAEFKVRINASDTLVTPGKPLTLQAMYAPETSVIQTIEWRPPDLFSRQDTLKQEVSITHETDFAIELVNAAGCSARNQVHVNVEKTLVYFPNIIKPGSADDAYFTAFSGEGVAMVKSMKILSRSGSVIFERFDFPPNDPLKGWNGRWKGALVQSGVYLWLAEIALLDGSLVRYEGTVTVIE